MSTWKIIGWTLGICMPVIGVIEFLSRWQKYRGRITLELFRLDDLAKTCPTQDLEKVWDEVCAFDDEASMSNTQMMKMATILAYLQGRRLQLKNDTAISTPAEDKRLTTPPHHCQLHRGEAGDHGTTP